MAWLTAFKVYEQPVTHQSKLPNFTFLIFAKTVYYSDIRKLFLNISQRNKRLTNVHSLTKDRDSASGTPFTAATWLNSAHFMIHSVQLTVRNTTFLSPGRWQRTKKPKDERYDQKVPLPGSRLWHPLSPGDQGHAQGNPADRQQAAGAVWR
ncbi:hypothetical protein [Marinobacter profundi]|uniref:hypothetical protein n=1 Tax=Marinobacter profundi TaxID=2666256 RepID=UPI001D17C8C6|nr:hypothetical protein [Marinobacter profundi]